MSGLEYILVLSYRHVSPSVPEMDSILCHWAYNVPHPLWMHNGHAGVMGTDRADRIAGKSEHYKCLASRKI